MLFFCVLIISFNGYSATSKKVKYVQFSENNVPDSSLSNTIKTEAFFTQRTIEVNLYNKYLIIIGVSLAVLLLIIIKSVLHSQEIKQNLKLHPLTLLLKSRIQQNLNSKSKLTIFNSLYERLSDRLGSIKGGLTSLVDDIDNNQASLKERIMEVWQIAERSKTEIDKHIVKLQANRESLN